jgi:hypothetical protein
MAIVVRSQGGKWQKATKVEFAAEAQLQKLLYDSPELIPTSYEEDQPAVFIREAGLPGSGYTDLLGVDERGNILVVETKLARNDEVRRKVIGQVLEYAAYLWQMSFEEFDSLFIKREGSSVLDLLEGRNQGIVREEVRNAIAHNLSSGAFQLFIAVDEMNEELEKIIGYVSSRGSGLRLEVLEFVLHQSGPMEILVPTRYGQNSVPDGTKPPKPIKTIDEIAATISDEKYRQMFLLLVQLWQEAGNFVKPGTVGASFQAKIGNKFEPIFWAYPSLLQNALGEISKHGAPEGPLKKYRQQMADLPGFNSAEVLSKPNPGTKYANLSEDTLRKFINSSLELVNEWRSYASPVEA